MTDSYWVRHRTLRGFVGPLSRGVLHGAVAAGSLPIDSEVRIAVAGAAAEALDENGWEKVHIVLGLAPPSPAEVRMEPPLPGAPGLRTESVFRDVRVHSNYGGGRRVVSALAITAAVALVVSRLVALGSVRTGGVGGGMVGVAVALELTISLALVYGLHQAFQMLADLADCALRRETDAAAKRAARGG